jgi:branched-chain amino acid transport system substrate-binding protein
MTGEAAPGGEMDWKGAQLAHKQRPTVGGKPVKLILVDDKTDKTESALAAARLIEVEKVHFVIGSWWSSLALAATEVTEPAGIPFLTPTCTNPLITAGRPLNFRLNFIDPYQGYALAKYAVENLGAKKAAILMDVQQDFSVGLAKYIRDSFQDLTGDEASVLGMFSFQTGDKDFTAQLQQIKSLDPDVVFAPIYHIQTALMLKQAADLGLKPPDMYFLGSTGTDAPELVEIAGAAGEDFRFSTSYEPSAFTSPIASKFKEDFMAEYGVDSDYSAVCSFDSYNIVLDAMEKAGTVEAVKLTDTLRAFAGWEGAGGLVTFDANGDPAKSVVIIRLENGQRVVDTIVEPD